MIAATAAIAAIAIALTLAFRNAGAWLVVSDPPQPSAAIVVLGGKVPFRAMEAASLYKQGWAREVWLTNRGMTDEDAALAGLGIDRPLEHVYSRLVLERMGVPRDAIRVLPQPAVNTADEMRLVAQAVNAAGGSRVMIVTSMYHTRRVKVLWRVLVGDRPQAIVRYTSGDPFDAAHWWRTTPDAMAVSREWFGILNARSRFPVKTQRE